MRMATNPGESDGSHGYRGFGWLDLQLAGLAPGYFVQSLLAAGALWTILEFVNVLTYGALVVAIAASTALTLFAPHSATASVRRMAGGITWALFSLWLS